jgi:hypothetical protein
MESPIYKCLSAAEVTQLPNYQIWDRTYAQWCHQHDGNRFSSVSQPHLKVSREGNSIQVRFTHGGFSFTPNEYSDGVGEQCGCIHFWSSPNTLNAPPVFQANLSDLEGWNEAIGLSMVNFWYYLVMVPHLREAIFSDCDLGRPVPEAPAALFSGDSGIWTEIQEFFEPRMLQEFIDAYVNGYFPGGSRDPQVNLGLLISDLMPAQLWVSSLYQMVRPPVSEPTTLHAPVNQLLYRVRTLLRLKIEDPSYRLP